MFICFEGIAGAGKTTQVKILEKYLKTKKLKTFVSAAYENKRRNLVSNFINKANIKQNKEAMMFLFQTLHAAQREEVLTALNKKEVVIADRWRYSFWTYHLQKKTFNGDEIIMKKMDELAFKSLNPDICFLLNLSPQLAYERYLKREKKINESGLNLVDFNYFKSVVKMYKKIAELNCWEIVDASNDEKYVFDQIKKIIDKKVC